MRHQCTDTLLKLAIGFTVVLSLTLGPWAQAERPSSNNIAQYMAMLGPVGFNDAGGVFLPAAIMGGLANGEMSPMMQAILSTHMMAACVDKVVKEVPARNDAYMKSAKAFEDGICHIRKCFQQGMLMSMLPQMSGNVYAGGSSSAQAREANQQQMLMLATAFKDDRCGDGGGDAIDPLMIMMLTQK